jgi:ATP-binding cassette subfamily B protein
MHWRFNHFVVLESVDAESVHIVDPAAGPRRVTAAELDENFTGVVLTMTPTDAFEPRKRRASTGRRYLGYAATALGSVGAVLWGSLLLELLGLLLPSAHQVILDTVIRPHQSRLLPLVAVTLFGAIALRAGLSVLRERLLAGIRTSLDLRLMGSFVDRLTTLPLDFFQQRGVGDLVSRVQANVMLRDTITIIASGALDAILVVAYATLMLAYDPRLGGLVLALTVGRVLIVTSTGRASRELLARELVAGVRESEATFTALTYPEAVRAFQVEPALLDRYRGGLLERLSITAERRAIFERVLSLLPLVDGLSRGVVLWLGGRAVMRDQMTIGVFASFLAIQAMLTRPLQSVVSALQQWQAIGRHLERLDDVFDHAPEQNGTREVAALRGHVALRGTTFKYGPRDPALLEGLSLEARPGEMVAIVGPSGAGKTTVLKLLMGFIDPTEGEVTYDGAGVRGLVRSSLRKHIGLVSQDAYFFRDTVRANLSLAVPDATDDELWSALRLACLDDVVRALPGGLDAPLGPGGGSLSGGQRQRLALARALVGRPAVLILDEATSSLDLDIEARVHQNLSRLGCTRIVVAHRLQTVRNADRIYVLSGGRVVQTGTDAALRRQPGLYAQLSEALS